MRRAVGLVVALVLAGVVAAAAAGDPAMRLLYRCERALGAHSGGSQMIEYHGTLTIEGHFTAPHATHAYESVRRIVITTPDSVLQEWTTRACGDTAGSVESTWLLGSRVLRRDNAQSRVLELHGHEAAMAARLVRSAVPQLLLADARRHRESLSVSGVERGYPALTWRDDQGESWTLRLDESTLLPLALEGLREDGWQGDIGDSVTWQGYPAHAHGRPLWMRTRTYDTDSNWWLDEARKSALWNSEPLPASSEWYTSLPESVTQAPVPAPAPTTPAIYRFDAHTWSVDFLDADTRSLVLEFADHVVVLEATSDGEHAERLLALVRSQLTTKPVRFVLFSHHHPDYTGGLRPFMADGATIVCDASLAPYMREIAARRFTRAPDRLETLTHGSAEPKLGTLRAGRWGEADALNELLAFDIGERSQHTDHYVVFWLPRAKLLFEGDLGYFTNAGELRVSRRATGLLAAVDSAGIAPAAVTQGWPVVGNAPRLPWERFRALVVARGAK